MRQVQWGIFNLRMIMRQVASSHESSQRDQSIKVN